MWVYIRGDGRERAAANPRPVTRGGVCASGDDARLLVCLLLGLRRGIDCDTCVSIRAPGADAVECHSRTARIASSKTVLRPFWVSAEHSRYFTAPMSLAIATPCAYCIGAMRLGSAVDQRAGRYDEHGATYRSLNFSMVPGSSRRSSFVPTRTIDVDGA